MSTDYYSLDEQYTQQVFLEHLREFPIGSEIATSVRIDTTTNININKLPVKAVNKIVLMNATTNQAIEHYTNQGLKVAALNFANAYNVGGGVLRGALAQEEELCRTSPMLYNSLMQFALEGHYYYKKDPNVRYISDQYPHAWAEKILYSDDVLIRYSNGTKGPDGYKKLGKPYKSSFITAAAPNIRKKQYGSRIKKTLQPYLTKMIKYIYMAPLLANSLIEQSDQTHKGSLWKPKKPTNKFNNVNVLILGAWGCGAFAPNGPVTTPEGTDYRYFIASLFYDILQEIDAKYDIVCFAIMKGGINNNYEIFENVLIKNMKYKSYLDLQIPRQIILRKSSTKKFKRRSTKKFKRSSIKKFKRRSTKKFRRRSTKKFKRRSTKKFKRRSTKKFKRRSTKKFKKKLFI
jgi:uncharacterized protein (TIGR02452 family)